MNWREAFFRNCGPGLLGGITLGQWARLLRDNWRTVHPRFWPRALLISLQSLKNSLLIGREQRRFGAEVEKVALHPPVFVIGHWRSGTTHLHELICRDQRFAYPNLYQVSFPHTFLSTEAADAPVIGRLLTKHRPVDNMEWSVASPQEDELALCALNFQSPYMNLVLPKRPDDFAKYLTFRDVPAAEVAEWRRAFEWFLKKVQWRQGRPLVLKSPTHTARIRLLLEMFPGAKFVHIHRNPYTVFQSTRQMFLKSMAWHALQRESLHPLNAWILRTYEEMHAAFFAEKQLIPAGQFHELGFEQLERDRVGELRKLYEALDLPAFAEAEPGLRQYVDSLAGFKKMKHHELSPELKAEISTRWRRNFDEWGYDREGS